MRVLVGSTAGSGHLRPLLPYVGALRDAGHEVALLAPASVEVDGLEHLVLPTLPDDHEERAELVSRAITLPPVEADRIVVGQVFGRLATGAALPGAIEHVERWRPDLVLHEAAEVSGRLAAEAAGVPSVLVHPSLPSIEHFLRFIGDGTNHLRAGLGLSDDPTGRWLRSGAHTTLLPEAMDFPDVDLPSLRRFRVEAPPSIGGGGAYVTLGTVAPDMPFFLDVLRAAIGATAAAGLATVASTGKEVDLGPLPDGVEVRTWVDQQEELRTARLLVCHGGSGSLLAGLAAGVPIVVVPLFADQPYNAERIEAMGVGRAVPPGPDLEARLTAAVAELIADPPAASDTVAAEIAALPLVAEAVPWLEAIADGS